MNKLIYLRALHLWNHDINILKNPKVGSWVAPHTLISYAGAFTRSRVCNTVPNFDFLSPSIITMPTASELGTLDSFENTFDSLITQYCTEFAQHNKTIYLSWSGGIDSTAIAVGFLRNAPKEILERIKLLCNQDSIKENPYFYHKFLKDKFEVCTIDTFALDSNTVRNSIIIDGEAGNQCMGNNVIAKLVFSNRMDILSKPWREETNLNSLVAKIEQWAPCHDNPDAVISFWMNQVISTVPYSPVPIETVYDFFWWANFDLKFTEVLLRKIPGYSKNLTPAETQILWDEVLVRPFASHKVQCWSLLSKDLRLEMTPVDLKYFSKKYIFDFDKNYHYFQSKTETGSYGITKVSNGEAVFAIDTEWNKYSLQRREDRQFLGRLIGVI